MDDDGLTVLFQSIDAKDADAFVTYLTDDAVFQYGSQAPVEGREAVRKYVHAFFESIQALEHELIETWAGEGSQVVQGRATYTRHDGVVLSVPFVNVFRFEGDAIREYLVHTDPAPLFA